MLNSIISTPIIRHPVISIQLLSAISDYCSLFTQLTVRMEVESIAHIRELEVSVLTDIKNSNSIIEIKKVILHDIMTGLIFCVPSNILL